MKNRLVKSSSISTLAAMLIIVTSCTKDNDAVVGAQPSSVKQISDKETQESISDLADEVPAISWYNSTMNKIITFDPKNNSKTLK